MRALLKVVSYIVISLLVVVFGVYGCMYKADHHIICQLYMHIVFIT